MQFSCKVTKKKQHTSPYTISKQEWNKRFPVFGIVFKLLQVKSEGIFVIILKSRADSYAHTPVVLQSPGPQEHRRECCHDESRPRPTCDGVARPLQTLAEIVCARNVLKKTTFLGNKIKLISHILYSMHTVWYLVACLSWFSQSPQDGVRVDVGCHADQEDNVPQDEAGVRKPPEVVGQVVGQIAALDVAIDTGEQEGH